MLIVLLAWVAIFAAAWGYGSLLWPEGPVRVYAGLLVLSTILCAGSGFARVSPWLFLFAAVGGACLGVRDGAPALRGNLLNIAVVAIPLSVLCAANLVEFYDTGLYHQQLVRWTSEYGMVPGLSLVYIRLGLTSSWFALAAGLNHGPLAGRTAGIIGGIPLVLAAFTVVTEVRHRKPAREQLAVTLALIGFIGVALVFRLHASLSPDLMSWLLPVMVAVGLAGAHPRRAGQCLVMAALAFAVKLTNAPVLLWCLGAAVVARKEIPVSRWLWTAAIIAVPLLINARVSGCPLFPAQLGCIPAAWSVAPEVLARFNRDFLAFAQLPRSTGLIVAITAGCTGWSLLKKPDGFVWHVLGISWVGICVLLPYAPVPRYALGYLLLPVAVAVASLLQQGVTSAPAPGLSAGLTGGFGLLAFLLVWVGTGPTQFLLLPRGMATEGQPFETSNRFGRQASVLRTRQRELGAVTVRIPVNGQQCWDAPLPCGYRPGSASIRLRNPARGFSAGFERTNR